MGARRSIAVHGADTHLDDVLWEVGHLGNVDAEALVADAGTNFVHEREVAVRGHRGHVQVSDARVLVLERGQLVEVGGKERKGLGLLGDVSAQTKQSDSTIDYRCDNKKNLELGRHLGIIA